MVLKLKSLKDLLENECSGQFEGAEYEISHWHLTIPYSKPKLWNISPKTKILLHLPENKYTSQSEGAEHKSGTNLTIRYSRPKFW